MYTKTTKYKNITKKTITNKNEMSVCSARLTYPQYNYASRSVRAGVLLWVFETATRSYELESCECRPDSSKWPTECRRSQQNSTRCHYRWQQIINPGCMYNQSTFYNLLYAEIFWQCTLYNCLKTNRICVMFSDRERLIILCYQWLHPTCCKKNQTLICVDHQPVCELRSSSQRLVYGNLRVLC